MFGFLLNFPWEILHLPLFEGKTAAPYWREVKVCLIGTSGDVIILLVAFLSIAVVTRDRRWPLAPRPRDVAGFLLIGIAITVAAEVVATEALGWWAYADAMPIVPLLGIGLSPFAQWIVLPPLVLWLVRRQLT